MTARVLTVTPKAPDPAAIAEAAAVLRAGGLVAFPTETVYGLGANALDETAVRRIFAAKGRPDFNPLIVHVADAEKARELVTTWPEQASVLAERFWPGPLTLVLPKRLLVPDAVTAGLGAVAIRVPAHPVALALIQAAKLPVAAPSANRFTELSPTSAEHVLKTLADRVDLVLDGGPTAVGIESTVLDLSGDTPRLLRPGMVSQAELESAIGAIAGPPVVAPGAARLSPGMTERHYAPRAKVVLTDAASWPAHLALHKGQLSGALILGDPTWDVAHPMRMPIDPVAYAARLYAALHALDDLGCQVVLVETPPADVDWAGVRDRLVRASS
ncbi:MAG TPA: L-threonylcarbamoyladenylate synthase [Gemmatimonadales bacterium]|nr:L-threonylcarbamoyladenylate synthase [Gemmatimonadales bacterium]